MAKVYAFNFVANTVVCYRSKKAAAGAGNSTVNVSSAEEFGGNVKIADLIGFYNDNAEAGEVAQVKGFKDKTTAAQRVFDLAVAIAGEPIGVEATETGEGAAPKPKKERKPRKEKAEGEEGGGRVSKFDGKLIVPALEENPRREGSKAGETLGIVYANPKGISFDDFIAAGGVQKLLYKAVRKGEVKLVDAA